MINNENPIPRTTTNVGLVKLFQDIQGNILKSHGRENVRLLFVKFNEKERAKAWIKNEVIPHVISMSEQFKQTSEKCNFGKRDAEFLSFSISNIGYQSLGVDTSAWDTDASFDNGMRSGTIGSDNVENWENEYKNAIHAIIIVASCNEDNLASTINRLEASMGTAVETIKIENGKGLDGLEHFGFADGRSQPRFFKEDLEEKEPSTDTWKPFASLDLVLTKDPFGNTFNSGITGNDSFPVDDNSGDHSFGSYLVFRKLHQDKLGWDKQVVQLSTELGIDANLIGAYAVGRFKDGTPVINHSSSQNDASIENDFDYSSEDSEMKCPFHSHIRKANPRGDSTTLGASLDGEKKRRIARRGIPYGNPQDEDKGLLFMCYQSNIKEQFDFMQNMWVDNQNFVTGNVGVDSVIGVTTNPIDKDWPNNHGGTQSTKKGFGQFVTMKGGEYFFTPSISALKSIVNPNNNA